ncbi:MAG: DNA alkylation repair protein [Ruminococcaceae bacterium]|nr:DNA alkylation repair protein [Oscillospiraceae bacterium]
MDTNGNITINNTEDIISFLLINKDEKYKDFTSSLIPSVDKNSVIGVRTPILRALAKSLKDTHVMYDYLSTLPHRYLEENHLHGFLIENVRDFSQTLKLTQEFLTYIDNWATCDTLRPKVFKKDLDTLYKHIKVWLKSKHTYTVRFAVGLLNSFYLESAFKEEHLSLVSSIKSDEYYINMMIAWYFATALAKQYDTTIIYIENKVLPKWTHNKAISKACESLRIDNDTKAYLRTLKIKP